MPTSRTLLMLAAAALCLAAPVVADDDLGSVVGDVKQIASPGIPGNLAVFGEQARALVKDAGNNVVVAAARFGKGGVVLWGHNGYLSNGAMQQADTGKLLLNCLTWLTTKKAPRVGLVNRSDLAKYLETQSIPVQTIALKDFDKVEVIIGAPTNVSSELRDRLSTWVRNGGGLVLGATGWGWAQLNPGKSLRTDFPVNQLLAPMGVVFASGMTRDSAKDGLAVDGLPPELLNASAALEAFERHADGDQKLSAQELGQVGASLAMALQSVPPEDKLFLPKLQQLIAQRQVSPLPSPKHPVTDKDVLERLVLTQQIREQRALPPKEVKPLPAAALFPGAAPADAKPVVRSLTLDTSVPGWHSTGLYANPGALITVTVPKSAAGKGFKIRLGSTTCRLWDKPKWVRCPEITREFTIRAPETEAASGFGGLVYVIVPKDCKLGEVAVTVAGGIEAPYFVLGKTRVEDWKQRLRQLPAPWAELASDKAILTVPSTVIRQLDDPAALMKTWNDILDYAADLAVRPHERDRPQRYVADIQLCAGYMHAGNPIMVPTSTAARLVDRNHLVKEGDWGFYHETGHMHQSGDWTFGGTGEVTVNFFTMYIFDKLCGIPPEKGRMSQAGMQKQYANYFAKGSDFARWKSSPFLALYTFYQLQQEFGWDAFKKVFASYHQQPMPGLAPPRNDDEKRDQWLIRFSRIVGKNLGPFFEAWGIPTSASARESVSKLPVWLPDNFPPKKAN